MKVADEIKILNKALKAGLGPVSESVPLSIEKLKSTNDIQKWLEKIEKEERRK
jgi:hypothetical protein